jgi:hypothetical protein
MLTKVIEDTGEQHYPDPECRPLPSGYRLYQGRPYALLTPDQIKEAMTYLPRCNFDLESYTEYPAENYNVLPYAMFPSPEMHRRSEIAARIMIAANLKSIEGENNEDE